MVCFTFHSGERKHPTDVARLRRKRNRVATKFPSPLKESLKKNEHPVCGVALSNEGFSGMKRDLMHMVQKPLDRLSGKSENAVTLRNSTELINH